MSGLNVLIIGAGVCGPALACLLRRSSPRHKITVVERWPTLRAAGQQIDLNENGLRILKRMGLLEVIKSKCVEEAGVEVFDSKGKSAGRFGVTPAGETKRGLTCEYEIMRGDVVQVLYDASLEQDAKAREEAAGGEGGLTYAFDKTVTNLVQDDHGANVTFSDGQAERFDLVVAADGLGSRTRKAVFGREASDAAFSSIGVHAAYFSIPRVEGEDNLAKAYSAPGRRIVMTRTSGRPITQVILFTMSDDTGSLKACYKQPIEKQKQAFAEKFKGAGWETERLLAGMATCEDFWSSEVAQIKMDRLHTGRVVLLGDAGYCPSPFTGMGTECCLIGAYVLAGELAERAGRSNSSNSDVVAGALQAYEEKMRAPVRDLQKLPGMSTGLFFPSSRIGVWLLRNLIWAWLLKDPT
ncbi:hypothetical protein M406DRAFT_62361 [Cryphonectria parasitica EP155]|uniref:FAD-binding domain-containing protein n=1 Tax=Cryphonectria parasitica (strain ATCC 38755 / EP155) TaxID=660469 RepID=A0A9P4Y0L0_CRYP1|nr:uncharacterized protein M406DRAFT_62361 [Cryphonectria parasitica EP155]KAF3764473.1 hypothetical protein M406DRAFT_62361 [Cryphonectria parasitica EP155]